MKITPQTIQKEFAELEARTQELKSAYYHVIGVDVEGKGLFRIVLYYDHSLQDFAHTIITDAGIEPQTKDIPREVLNVAGSLFDQIDKWKAGEIEYPFTSSPKEHVVDPFKKEENYFTADHDVDDSELDM